MTDPISLDQARAYLKADGDDDDLIVTSLASARSICQDYCNRVFYDTQDDSDADFIEALTDRADALAARETAYANVTSIATTALITSRYRTILSAIEQRINGIVIDDAINAAILLTLGHLYVNREDNVSTGNNVVQVPVGAQRILQPKLYIGNLIASDCDDEHHHCQGS